jgi:hypothetical protein
MVKPKAQQTDHGPHAHRTLAGNRYYSSVLHSRTTTMPHLQGPRKG